jgi:hypothetical protein
MGAEDEEEEDGHEEEEMDDEAVAEAEKADAAELGEGVEDEEEPAEEGDDEDDEEDEVMIIPYCTPYWHQGTGVVQCSQGQPLSHRSLKKFGMESTRIASYDTGTGMAT